MIGATCEPMCVGIGNVELIKPKPRGERIVIFGAGIIGQSLYPGVQGRVRAVRDRRGGICLTSAWKLAKQSGADYIINPGKGKSAYDTMAEIWGYGEYAYHDRSTKPCGNATIAVECTSNMGCVAEAMDIVTSGGKVCYAAGYGDEDKAMIRPVNMMMKGVQIIPGLMGNFAKSVKYMSRGQVPHWAPDHPRLSPGKVGRGHPQGHGRQPRVQGVYQSGSHLPGLSLQQAGLTGREKHGPLNKTREELRHAK